MHDLWQGSGAPPFLSLKPTGIGVANHRSTFDVGELVGTFLNICAVRFVEKEMLGEDCEQKIEPPAHLPGNLAVSRAVYPSDGHFHSGVSAWWALQIRLDQNHDNDSRRPFWLSFTSGRPGPTLAGGLRFLPCAVDLARNVAIWKPLAQFLRAVATV